MRTGHRKEIEGAVGERADGERAGGASAGGASAGGERVGGERAGGASAGGASASGASAGGERAGGERHSVRRDGRWRGRLRDDERKPTEVLVAAASDNEATGSASDTAVASHPFTATFCTATRPFPARYPQCKSESVNQAGFSL